MAIPGMPLSPLSDDEQDPLAMPGVRPIVAPRADPAGGGASTVIAALAPPAVSTTTTSPTSSVSEVESRPEAHEAIKKLQTARDVELEAARLKGDAEIDLAKVEQQKQEALANALAEEAARKQEAAERHRSSVEAAVARDRDARARLEKASHITDYWEDKGAPARILGAFMTAVSTYSHMRAGKSGPGPAYQMLQDEMARDRQAKLDRFTASKEFQRIAATDVDAAREALADELKTISTLEAARRAKIAAAIESTAGRAKMDSAKAAAQAFTAKVAEDNAAAEAKDFQHWDRKITRDSARQSTTVNTAQGAGGGPKDLTLTDENGKVYQARSPTMVDPLRDQKAAYMEALRIGQEMIEMQKKKGKWAFVPDQEFDTKMGLLLEKKKAITGAQTEGDEARMRNKVKAGILKGPEAANAAIADIVGGMRGDFRSRLNEHAIPYSPPEAPAAAPGPAPAPAKREPPPRNQKTAGALSEVKAKLKSLGPNDPERARWEAIRDRLEGRN